MSSYSQSAPGHASAPPAPSSHAASMAATAANQSQRDPSAAAVPAAEASPFGSSIQQAGQQAVGAAREKLQEFSQKAQETTQYAASQVREGIRHPARAAPFVIPILAVVMIFVATLVPIALMVGKAEKFDYDESDYGHRARSIIHDKWENARDALSSEYSPVQSFSDKVWGRKSPSDDLQYQGQRALDEGEHRFSDYWHRAKDKMFGSKESAEENAAASREFMLHSIDKLGDKLQELRNYCVRGHEEKPSWIRNSWDSLMDGMYNLRNRLLAR